MANNIQGFRTRVELKSRKHDHNDPTDGQLKLAVYMNHGLLTIHVVRSRHLRSKWREKCNSYVRLSLVPDADKRTRCKTDIVPSTNKPLFDQKFSFEVLEEDHDKRLLISSWHRDGDHSKSELLGCMSFGVRHLVGKGQTVSGWYHMLTESLGRKKHLKVSSNKLTTKQKNIPEVNTECLFMDPITLTMKKGDKGFGFTVAGSCPCHVGKLEAGSVASLAGMKEGDFIIRVSGQNVSRSTGDSVIRMLRHSKGYIKIGVQRPSQIEKLAESPRKLRTLESKDNKIGKQTAKLDCHTKHTAEKASKTDAKFVEVERIGEHPMKNPVSLEGISSLDSNTIKQASLSSKRSHSSEGTMGDDLKCSKPTSTTCSSKGKLKEKSVPSRSCASDGSVKCAERVGTTLSWPMEVPNSSLLASVVNCEQEYIHAMQYGIQRYSRPLRHRIISPHEYATLFQNVEKLVAISECHHKQLSALESTVGDGEIMAVYLSKIHLMCNAYKDYCTGLCAATHLFTVLQQYPEFNAFIKETNQSDDYLDVIDFIEKPKHHIVRLSQIFSSVDITDFTNNKDLRTFIDTLSTCCSNITETGYKPSWDPLLTPVAPMPSPESGQPAPCPRLPQQPSSKSLTSVQSGVSAASSLDQEVLSIQNRLVFDTNVPVFQLCMNGRHLIYTGEIIKSESTGYQQLLGLLFSDVLMLCRPEGDGYFAVVETPLDLKTVSRVDSDRQHSAEFKITYVNEDGYNDTLTLQATTPELKHAWSHIIQLRINLTKSPDSNQLNCQTFPAAQPKDNKKTIDNHRAVHNHNANTGLHSDCQTTATGVVHGTKGRGSGREGDGQMVRSDGVRQATMTTDGANQVPVKVIPNWDIIHEMMGKERVVDQMVIGYGAQGLSAATHTVGGEDPSVATHCVGGQNVEKAMKDDAEHNVLKTIKCNTNTGAWKQGQQITSNKQRRALQNLTNKHNPTPNYIPRYGSLRIRRPKFESTDGASSKTRPKRPLSQELKIDFRSEFEYRKGKTANTHSKQPINHEKVDGASRVEFVERIAAKNQPSQPSSQDLQVEAGNSWVSRHYFL